ncbi:MAG: hypothetical protein AB1405_17960, partial [Bdellovibrionota bacterium]
MPLSREKSLPFAAALGTAVLSSGAITRWNPWVLEWAALVPAFFFLPEVSKRWPDRGPLLFGWVCGFFTHLFVFRWLTETVTRFTNLPWPVAVGILLLFAASHGLLWALWLFASERLVHYARWPRPLALPAVYVVCAAFLPQLFPWFVGMAQHHFHPFAQIAAVGGIELAVFLVVLANTALAGALRAFADREKVSWKPLAAAVGAAAAACFYGTIHLSSVDETLAAAPEVRVALLQPNVEAKLAKGPTESADRL